MSTAERAIIARQGDSALRAGPTGPSIVAAPAEHRERPPRPEGEEDPARGQHPEGAERRQALAEHDDADRHRQDGAVPRAIG
jgi:hypothetical protein